MFLLQMISRIDILGKKFELKIDNGLYKTCLGGILTLCLSILGIYIAWYFGDDIYLRENPSILTKSTLLKDYPLITLNNSNFFFALRVEKNNKPVDDKTIFEYIMDYRFNVHNLTSSSYNTTVHLTFDMERCSEKHIDSDTLNKLRLFNYFCADLNNLDVGGSWEFSLLQGIVSYRIKRCNNETEKKYNLKCKSDKELGPDLDGNTYYVSSIIENRLFDPKNYTKPVHRQYEYEFGYLSFQGFSDKKITYTNTQIETNDGLIWEHLYNETYIKYDNMMQESSNFLRADAMLYFYSFYVSNNQIFIERNYIKIQTIAAIVGGFMNIVRFFLDFLFGFYINNAYNLHLYKKILHLEIDDNIGENAILNNVNNIDKKSEKTNLEIELPNFGFNKVHRDNQDNIPNIINNDQSLNPLPTPTSLSPYKNLNPNQYPNSNDKSVDQMINFNQKNNNNDFNKIKKEFKFNNLNEVIQFKKKKRVRVKLQFWENFCYLYCCLYVNEIKNQNNINKLRFELMAASEEEVNQRLDGINLINQYQQFKLFRKIILNSNQCTMLENRDRKVIVNKPNLKKNQFKEIYEEKEREKIINLVNYLQAGVTGDKLNQVDIMLYNYLIPEIREKIEKELK